MTPLAHRIVRELTLPSRDRTMVDEIGLLEEMRDVHCFETTAILDAVRQTLTAGIPDDDEGYEIIQSRLDDMSRQTSFLPAPKTWIEWASKSGTRIGFLMQGHEGFADTLVAGSLNSGAPIRTAGFIFSFGLGTQGTRHNEYHVTRDLTKAEELEIGNWMALLNVMLAFINSPRVIGREEHRAHRGLEKKLAASLRSEQAFRLHPWTEIKLHVTPPRDAAGDGEHEAHLTGQRALHFCRSHLRVRNGRLETVRAHWRGDPSFGVKRSRYKLTADKGIENAA